MQLLLPMAAKGPYYKDEEANARQPFVLLKLC